MDWSPQQYRKFEDERTRPVRDLVAAIPADAPARVIDLGCGPGNSTEVLAARFPGAEVSGLDNSPEMIAVARARLGHIDFSVADLASWEGAGRYDVILSNAVLQWLTHHETLLPHLVDGLAPGGSLAVQMPDNLEEPAYRIMREVAALPQWRERLRSAAGRGSMLTAEAYWSVLHGCCRRVDVWRTTYFHALPGADAVVAWFEGSGLRPYLAVLDEPDRAAFRARFLEGVTSAYTAQSDGTVLLPFPRLFMVGTK